MVKGNLGFPQQLQVLRPLYILPIYPDLPAPLKHQLSQLTVGGWRIEESTLGEV